MKNGWGKMSSYVTSANPFVCVDTERGRIVVTFTMIVNANARIEGVTNIMMSTVTYILMVNNDKKIVRWDGIWDNNIDDAQKAYARLGVQMPSVDSAPMFITCSEGEVFATKLLKAFSDGFLDNSHAEKCHDLFADKISWDWSDGHQVRADYVPELYA